MRRLVAAARIGSASCAVSTLLETRPITMCCKVGRVSVGFVVSLLGVRVWYLVGLCHTLLCVHWAPKPRVAARTPHRE